LRYAERLDELAAFAVSLGATDGADVLAAVSEALSQCAAASWLMSRWSEALARRQAMNRAAVVF